MRIGVIGVGSMGKNHVRIFTEIKKVEEVVIYDKNYERAKEVAEKYDVDVVNSINDLIRLSDAVSICSPTSMHFKHVKTCVDAEKHVLVEKPITSNYDEARKILEILNSKEIVFGVGHIERFNPIVSEIVGLEIMPVYINIRRHNPASHRIRDSTVIEDLMIHDIDIVFNVLFPNRNFKLKAMGDKNIVQVLVSFGDSMVSLSASRISSKKIRTIYLEHPQMTVEGDFMNQELYIFRKPSVYQTLNEKYVQENVIEKVLVNKVEPLKVELKTFVDAINGKKEFPVNAEQAAKNVKICEMIRGDIGAVYPSYSSSRKL